MANMESFAVAINRVLYNADQAHPVTDIAFVPDSWWVQATAHTTETLSQQTYSYNLVEGYFLVDGKAIGQLPTKHRESTVLRSLFGNQTFHTRPSRLYGMTHMVAHTHHGHQVHFGFREDELFVRAIYHGHLLEFIPQHHFIEDNKYDLPAPLVDNCAHWLDLATGELEVRAGADIWRSKSNNWIVNLHTRTAGRQSRTWSKLVDPFSHLSRRMTATFAHFEDAKHLVISQSWPTRRPPLLRVELRRLDLTFSVNKEGLLESPQVRSEIDPNQDVGTWYGLMSSLVLRNVVNPSRRIVLVPLGPLEYMRKGCHVTVHVQNRGEYGQFTINETLGRIECPPEPLLVYSKALFHAFTSFVTPDPLTGRTGTEESLHCLKSGLSSPWIPLNQRPMDVLSRIATLIPLREYYPKDMKVMERVTWDPKLPFMTQHDGFLPVLNAIVQKSRRLALFSPSLVEIPTMSSTDAHLSDRARQRRMASERPWESTNAPSAPDARYQPRHIYQQTTARENVYRISQSIISRPPLLPWSTKTPISTVVKSWTDVGGFTQPYDSPFLSDLLSTRLDRDWGSFVTLCHKYNADQDGFKLLFILALLAFRDKVPMALVWVLVAFAIYPDFKELDLPQAHSFVHFQYRHAPSVNELVQLMTPHTVTYTPKDNEDLGHWTSTKMRQRINTAKKNHEQDVRTESEGIARLLLQQWPCEEPTTLGFPPGRLVDLPGALASILPEWHRLHQNWLLSTWIGQVQEHLCLRQSNRGDSVPDILCGRNVHQIPLAMLWRPCLSELLSSAQLDGYVQMAIGSRVVEKPLPSHTLAVPAPAPSSEEDQELQDLVRTFAQSKSTIRKDYAAALMNSIESLRLKRTVTDKGTKKMSDDVDVSQSLEISQRHMHDIFRKLAQGLEENDQRCRWLKFGGLWPAVTPVAFLEELRSISPTSYNLVVRKTLTAYAISITESQRFTRMRDSHLQRNTLVLEQDRENRGHTNWNPLDQPDWLLLEIEANILLRPNQSDVATATIWPPSQENSLLQMNMGEGDLPWNFLCEPC